MSNRIFQYISRMFGGKKAADPEVSFEELLKKEILQDKTFFIHGFRSFQVIFTAEFNELNYAHMQSLIEKRQTAHFNKEEFTNEHTLEVMSVAKFVAQDNIAYIAIFYDPVDYFSNPELQKIYQII